MQLARAYHCAPYAELAGQDSRLELQGRPERANEAFSDLPGYGGLAVAWVEMLLPGVDEAPPRSSSGECVEVEPCDLGSGRVLRAFRRRDGRGFPAEGERGHLFYTLILADTLDCPAGFSDWFVEVDGSDAVELHVTQAEWTMRKPIPRQGRAHVHVAISADLRPSSLSGILTEEQREIVNTPLLDKHRQGIVRILASAGSGKTTTLKAIAETIRPGSTRPPHEWHTVYAVFNKSMQEEACEKFKDTFVDCRTWDALANAYVRRHCNGGGELRIIDDVEATLDGDDRLLWRVVRCYCLSPDISIGTRHVDQAGVASGPHDDPDSIVQRARKLFDRAANLGDGEAQADHSVIFKLCQLDMFRSHRRLSEPPARLMLCDEYQDISPVQDAVLRMEAESCLAIVVGDPGQSIYKFRGACKALQDLSGSVLESYQLCGSFRFGTQISDAANLMQKLHVSGSLGDFEVLACHGLAEDRGEVHYGDFPELRPHEDASYTVICRTNKQATTLALKLLDLEPHRQVEFLGQPLRQELQLIADLLRLRGGEPIRYRSRELVDFCQAVDEGRRLKEFHDYCLNRAVDMVERYGDDLLRLLDSSRCAGRSSPPVMFCTVHQAKGLEWDTVVLGHGCNVQWLREAGVWKLTHDAVNCLYVAATRAKRSLYLPSEIASALQALTVPVRPSRDEAVALATRGKRAESYRSSGVAITKLEDGCFQVPSQTKTGLSYKVNLQQGTCECPDFQRRRRRCKHLLAVAEHA